VLRFPEEIMLLLLDDEGGDFVRVPEWSVQCALAGAVLMDLALENRIDTDPNWLTVIDPTPVGDDLLDPTLERIAQADGERDTRFWIQDIAQRAGPIRERVLERLVDHGILHVRDEKLLWVFQARRYPAVDGKADREVKLRIMEVLFSDEIPDPRDIVIVCLAEACGIFRELLSRRELEHVTGRIEQVRKLDLIGREVSQAVWDIETSLALTMHPLM